VLGALKSQEQREAFVAENRAAQQALRKSHAAGREDKPLLPIAEARKRRTPIDWAGYVPPKPSFVGVRTFDPYPLGDLVPYIDWSPFFHAWELKGTYPRIFENAAWGARAKELFDDAQALLRRIVAEGRLTARAAMAFFPAAADGDDIVLYGDDARAKAVATLHTLRQQNAKPEGQPNQALSDFVAPAGSGLADYLGLFAVTAGIGIESLIAEFERDHDDYSSIMAKALADRLAEALAEALHRRAREEWGYGRGEALGHEDLIREKYRGIRPAPGYPAQPDHTEKKALFELLRAGDIGMRLTESFAMMPAASVSGLYFSHPEARYFQVGRIGADQVADYARRKRMPVEEVERWLAPNLDYEPARAAAAR
jgi:5-methyltetrahydrofolate--homocysteine methyltransferase